METNNIVLAIIIIAVLVVAGYFIFLEDNPSNVSEQNAEVDATDEGGIGGDIFTRVGDSPDEVLEEIPDADPFGGAETNPFSSAYKNPFE